jgi:glycosyltransferase involved in cell wall biosynthesis
MATTAAFRLRISRGRRISRSMRLLRVVNAMFGARLGGLEQVFVDYSEVLALRGHAIVNFVAPGAQSAPALRALGQQVVEIGNFNQWDPIADFRLRRALAAVQADAAIAHGNRAIHLMRRAARGVAPLIAVNHNVNVKSAVGADFAIAINEDMRSRLLLAGQPEVRLAKLFNMIRRPSPPPRPAPLRSPPVIGAMGRFVEKKGFDVFLEGVARLKAQGRSVRAILAGSGPLEATLKAQAAALGLTRTVTFPGWVSGKAAFFEEIDVFAFTSHHDVCPVVLLEAFIWAKPVVLADCPGPREISSDGEDSLLFPVGDAAALAERVGRILDDPTLGPRLGAAAQAKIWTHHTFEPAGERLEAILARACEERSETRRAYTNRPDS